MAVIRRQYPLGSRGLGIVLLILFLGSWVGQAIFQVAVLDESWADFWAATLENWQSEFLSVLTFVVLTAYIVYQGSPESKSSDDELSDKVDEILRRLDESGK
jgi:membrane protein implicated in regulation of membrane protease activity